jgi:CDP-paratose 2-epimerase
VSEAGGGHALVTGGAGFIGSNLADRLAAEGHRVLVLDSLARPGVERNLRWLKERHGERVDAAIADVRDQAAVANAMKGAAVVFHFAAQVAVTDSLADPAADFEVNLGATFNLLETARRQRTPVIFASTNKVYGDLADIPLERVDGAYLPLDEELRRRGVAESRPLDFHTPYGCSKGGADAYALDYARSYGLPTCVFRMSCVYGPRQMGTEDQGWVAHFLIKALNGEPITIFGDGRQVRDVLCVGDVVDAYLAAWRNIDAVSGRAFNIGGGPDNAVSLKGMLAYVEELAGRPLKLVFRDWRKGDQKYFVADASAAQAALGLRAPTPWRAGVAELARWLRDERMAGDTALQAACG